VSHGLDHHRSPVEAEHDENHDNDKNSREAVRCLFTRLWISRRLAVRAVIKKLESPNDRNDPPNAVGNLDNESTDGYNDRTKVLASDGGDSLQHERGKWYPTPPEIIAQSIEDREDGEYGRADPLPHVCIVTGGGDVEQNRDDKRNLDERLWEALNEQKVNNGQDKRKNDGEGHDHDRIPIESDRKGSTPRMIEKLFNRKV
jgi:hypothetical protein